MCANKLKLKLSNTNLIKIPFSLDFNQIGQSDVINEGFVTNEVDNSINPIIDYEKVRFEPKKMDGSIVNDITIRLNFLNNSEYKIPTYYSDIGFVNDDIIYRKNKFTNSFLKLSFYDSDIPTSQNLISIITIFSKLNLGDLRPLILNGENVVGGGLPFNADEIAVNYILNNPITKPTGFAEGFNLYHFRSDLEGTNHSEIFMRAEFNNAATGKKTKFITTDELLDINSLIKKLHTRYLLTRDNTGYYYTIDGTYNNSVNVNEHGDAVYLDLYEIRVK